MFGRSLLTANLVRKSFAASARRQIHKAAEGTPPMRYISISQKVALYFFIVGAFLSYPSYVLYNLDNLRPRSDQSLSPEVIEELEARKAAKKG